MRILFAVFGTRPHLYPLVPLAWAFRAAGHEVRLASTPRWATDISYTGLSPVAVGGPPQVTTNARDDLAAAMFSQHPWPSDWAANMVDLAPERLAYLESIGRYLIAAAAAMVDDLVAFARSWAPDLVVYDSFSYAGPVTAAALGVPGIRHLSGTDSAQRLEMRQPSSDPLPEYVSLFARFGMPATTEPSATVDPTPPSLRLVTPSKLHPMRYMPYNGPGSTPEGLMGQRSRPRVCVTWGHTMSTTGDGLLPFRAAINAIAIQGMDCLIAAPAREIELLGPLPPSARALASVPLHLVLPYCDAIVHQGGDGTALTAATTANPQLIIASSPEADMCGGRITAAGAGIAIRYESHAMVREAVQKLLSVPGYREGAEGLRDEIEAQPTPAEVVRSLVGG